MVARFHLDCLGHRIKYGNPEVENTTQQFLSTTRPCCSSEFIESILFWVILVTYNVGIYICIYIYKVSFIHSFLLSSTVKFFLHCMLNVLRLKKYFVKLLSRLVHSTVHQVMWYFLVFIVNPFSLLCSVFFLKNTMFPLVSFSLAYCCINQRRYFWQIYCGFYFENYVSLLNNIVNLTWWT